MPLLRPRIIIIAAALILLSWIGNYWYADRQKK